MTGAASPKLQQNIISALPSSPLALNMTSPLSSGKTGGHDY